MDIVDMKQNLSSPISKNAFQCASKGIFKNPAPTVVSTLCLKLVTTMSNLCPLDP